MSGTTAECSVFRTEDLLPEAWKHHAAAGPVRTFNPGLLREHDGWLLAYRVVAADGLRRIAIARLDANRMVIPGSPIPLTDYVRFRPGADYPETARQWFADPRIYRLGERLFIYWNSGWHEPRNYQFVQELETATLLPRGNPRELVLHGQRQKLEKNWTFFRVGTEPASEFHAIYSITPHRVLAFSIAGEGDIAFEEVSQREWSLPGYPPNHGGLRGGAPPVRMGECFWSFCHSVHNAANGYRYAIAAYAFAAKKPFEPLVAPTKPLELAADFASRRTYPRLNPAVGDVIYPCGAAPDGARWLISHGINDELCALSSLRHEDVVASVQEVSAG